MREIQGDSGRCRGDTHLGERPRRGGLRPRRGGLRPRGGERLPGDRPLGDLPLPLGDLLRRWPYSVLNLKG